MHTRAVTASRYRTQYPYAQSVPGYGLGFGLFWGEGNKKDEYAVRLGNTDPKMIKYFLKFLRKFYHIKEEKIRFGLQIFGDMDVHKAEQFWISELGVSSKQFMKTIVTPVRGSGSYRQKTKYGVLTVYFSNKKLRKIICDTLESM